jgi:hypothetical protein
LVLNELSEHVNSPMELQLKILQTILPLLTNYKDIYHENVANARFFLFLIQPTGSFAML